MLAGPLAVRAGCGGEARVAVATAAQNSPHPVSACYGLVFSALILQLAGQFDEALHLATRARTLAGEKGFAYWVATAQGGGRLRPYLRGGNPVEGREMISEGHGELS